MLGLCMIFQIMQVEIGYQRLGLDYAQLTICKSDKDFLSDF